MAKHSTTSPNYPDLNQFSRALVIILRHHGDVLLTSPIFSELKQHYPNIQTDVLLYQETAPMLALNPNVGEVISIDKNWKHLKKTEHLKHEWNLYRRLKKNRYDLVIHLTSHWRGAMLSRLLRPRCSVAPGFSKKKRQGKMWLGSFSHFYPYKAGPHKHTVDKYLDALRYLNIPIEEKSSRLSFNAGDKAESSVKKTLSEANFERGNYILIHPTSRWMFKCWTESRMSDLIKQLSQEGYQLVITAAPDKKELDMVDRLLATAQVQTLNLAGKINLKELGALIKYARLFIGVDSVPMHMAAALQTPSVALFGPSEEKEWSPWLSPNIVINSRAFPRNPDDEMPNQRKYKNNLSNVPFEPVWKAVQKQLANHPAVNED